MFVIKLKIDSRRTKIGRDDKKAKSKVTQTS